MASRPDSSCMSDLEFISSLVQDEIQTTVSAAPCVHTDSNEIDIDEEDTASDDDDVSSEGEHITPTDDTCVAVDDSSDVESELDDIGDESASSNTALDLPPRTAHEIEEPVEEVDVKIPPEAEIILVGEVLYHICGESTVVIQSLPTSTPLDEGSVLCLADRSLIGKVGEVFGPLSQPFYVVRWAKRNARHHTSINEIGNSSHGDNGVSLVDLAPGTAVYAPSGLCSVITPLSLQTILTASRAATDASNLYDEEVGEEEQEFSDDEKEAEFKRKKSQQQKKEVGERDSSYHTIRMHNNTFLPLRQQLSHQLVLRYHGQDSDRHIQLATVQLLRAQSLHKAVLPILHQ